MKLNTGAGLIAFAFALVLAGCGAVKVAPSGTGVTAASKPADCPLEFLDKAPARPFDELAELSSQVSSPPRAGAQEALREPACHLGADAVIVTRNFVMNAYGHVLVAGTAIKYRAAPAVPTPEERETPPGPGVDL